MKIRFRSALLGLACVALTSFLVAADVPTAPTTVWDGDSASDGKAWTSPATNKLEPSDSVHNKGKKALAFKGVGEGYIGCGWNWCGWWPADAGTDISGCDRMRFNFKLTGDAKPDDFKINIVSNNAKKTDPIGIAKYMSASDKGKIDDGEWHEITIPLKDMYGDKKEFDPKAAWEFDLAEWAQDKKDFTAYVDLVQFLPPEPKPAATAPAATAPAATAPAATAPAK